jgi:Holliday junction resolvasome RuvABC endonuclease subunit
MVILSIDPAVSKKIAYALFKDGDLKLYGKFDKVQDLAMLFNHNIDLVVTEEMYLGENPKTFGQLSKIVGKIELLCDLYNIKCREIVPATWKAHHGLINKPKDFVQKLEDKIIETLTDKKIDDQDIKDAILLGLCHIEQQKWAIKFN